MNLNCRVTYAWSRVTGVVIGMPVKQNRNHRDTHVPYSTHSHTTNRLPAAASGCLAAAGGRLADRFSSCRWCPPSRPIAQWPPCPPRTSAVKHVQAGLARYITVNVILSSRSPSSKNPPTHVSTSTPLSRPTTPFPTISLYEIIQKPYVPMCFRVPVNGNLTGVGKQCQGTGLSSEFWH